MKHFIIYLLIVFFSISSLFAQQDNEVIKQSPKQDKKAVLDSLVKNIRNEFYKKNYEVTIEEGERVISFARKTNDYKAIFEVSSIIGNAFLNIEDTIQAKRLFTQTLNEAEKLDDLENILSARLDLANMYYLEENYESAISLYKKALPLAENFNDTVYLFLVNHNIAQSSIAFKNSKDAEYYVKQMNNYLKNLKAQPYHAGAEIINGKYYLLKKMPNEAIKHLKNGIRISEEVNFKEGIIEGYELYAQSEILNKNYKKAFELQEIAEKYKSEKYKTDKIEAIEMATARYKINQFKQEIKANELQNVLNRQKAKRETTIVWIKIASGILLVFSVFLFISYSKRRKLYIDLKDKNQQYLKAKEKSEQLSRSKSNLYSTISHELRTPIYGIIGITDILLEDKSLLSHKDNIQALKYSANYLRSLINNVLHLNKLDTLQKEQLKVSKFNIRELVNSVVKSTKFLNTENKNQFDIKIDDAIPNYLIGSSVKLSQVLINLLGNATKFTENGLISLRIDKKEEVGGQIILQFFIKDTGKGISEEKQALLWDEFAQATTGENYQGTGLGLPIVKKILDLHESKIHLTSVVGKGTEISFEILYDLLKNFDSTSEFNLEEECLKFENKKILVVDDNKINLLVTKKNLEKFKACISLAGSGEEAVESVRTNKYDLVLMDINMPGINGFEATVAIRKFNNNVPIIALTAVELEQIQEDKSFALMNDFIIKPYSQIEFISTITSHLSTSEKLIF